MGTAMVLMFSGLGIRLVQLHIWDRERFTPAVQAERVREIAIVPQRGAILSANDEVIACDRTVATLICDRRALRDPNLGIRTLADRNGVKAGDVPRLFSEIEIYSAGYRRTLEVLPEVLGVPKEQIEDIIGTGGRGEVILARDLEDDRASQVAELLERESLPGLELRPGTKRLYPNPTRAGQIVGLVNAATNEGLEGIERTMNRVLAGKPGRRVLERDRRGGQWRPRPDLGVPVTDGNYVRLTLNMTLQNIVEDALEETGHAPGEVYVGNIKPERVTVILMDPREATVLAMANWPSMNLETRSGVLRNAAVSDTYEPGSTFKLCTYTGVFDGGLTGPTDIHFLHHGRFDNGVYTLVDDDPKGYADTNWCFAHSSNIGAFKMAQMLGPQRFHGMMTKFGFGEKTGIELTAEAPGVVKDPDEWQATSLSRMSIGYEVAATPLQIVTAYTAILNDGVLKKPRIVDAILSPDNQVLEKRKTQEVRRVCSADTARLVRRAMRRVVTDGTGKLAAIPGIDVAGKTGTAQKVMPGKGYTRDNYIVSFVGFAPFDDPRIVGLVVVDDPKVEGRREYGSFIAAPIFRRIAERALVALGQPVHPAVTAATAADGSH